MCEKSTLGDLNPGLCPLYPISTYTCGVSITLKVCGGRLRT